MAGLLSVFAAFEHDVLRERVRAGLAEARMTRKRLGRPITAGLHAIQFRKLHRSGVSKAEIARRLKIGRISVPECLPDLFSPRDASLMIETWEQIILTRDNRFVGSFLERSGQQSF
jgi:DNA invertase Pin-like site-specific DNA recombinase